MLLALCVRFTMKSLVHFYKSLCYTALLRKVAVFCAKLCAHLFKGLS